MQKVQEDQRHVQAFHAHSLEGRPEAAWQPLSEHLQAVAGLAQEFAARFGGGQLAHLAGLLHDLGKYTREFQSYIRGTGCSVDHASWGAKVALERFKMEGYLVAYAIAGHHAGLANGAGDAEGQTRSSLQTRLDAALPKLLPAWQQELTAVPTPQWPAALKPRHKDHASFTASFLIRMVFSCLVDADYLDTERFYARAEGSTVSRGMPGNMPALQAALQGYLAAKARAAASSSVNTERQRVLQHVRAQAGMPTGLYSLTVPTGGGKTLTSLAFGLDHAVAHGLSRLIYVIPFTSIVEQNAQVFREALHPLGDAAVLEHHSAFVDDPRQAREARQKTQLAMENWDAPVVVTTAVQFFESLFGARPSQCRKLHNVAGSVIVLDEAQTLPLHLLRPTLLALDELARNYGCTIVFCTATQPALADARFHDVIGAMHELAPEPAALFQTFRRVSVRHVGALADAQITERLAERPQALCIVNNRLHARALYHALAHEAGTTYLSTLMCARHRSAVLDGVRQALQHGEPCRVISTSLIEAGVDVSFPFVMRAEAGLDSVAQAAGRCNREGRWATEASEVQVFAPDTDLWKPPKELQQFAAVGSGVLRKHADDPLSPAAIQCYFEDLYWARGTSPMEKKMLRLLTEARLESLPFEELARLYRVIDTVQASVIVPWDGKAQAAIKELPFAKSVRALARQLQPYIVQVPRSAFDQLRAVSAVQPAAEERWGDQFMVLVSNSLYCRSTGLQFERPIDLPADALVL